MHLKQRIINTKEKLDFRPDCARNIPPYPTKLVPKILKKSCHKNCVSCCKFQKPFDHIYLVHIPKYKLQKISLKSFKAKCKTVFPEKGHKQMQIAHMG